MCKALAEGTSTEPSALFAPNTAQESPLRQRLARYDDVSSSRQPLPTDSTGDQNRSWTRDQNGSADAVGGHGQLGSGCTQFGDLTGESAHGIRHVGTRGAISSALVVQIVC